MFYKKYDVVRLKKTGEEYLISSLSNKLGYDYVITKGLGHYLDVKEEEIERV